MCGVVKPVHPGRIEVGVIVMEWMLMPLKRYADFSGRSRRMEYWMFYLFIILFVIVAMLIGGLMAGLSETLGAIFGIVAIIAYIALFVPSLAVAIRRMHDTDHSGWWILCPIVPLIFALTPGTIGPNRFGDDPKGGIAGDTFS